MLHKTVKGSNPNFIDFGEGVVLTDENDRSCRCHNRIEWRMQE